MKKTLILFMCLYLFNSAITGYASTDIPPIKGVIIENFTPQEIQRVIAMYVPNWGWDPDEANEFRMSFSRKENYTTYSNSKKKRLNKVRESRVTFYFTYIEAGKICVDVAHSVIENYGSDSECQSYGGERNYGSISRVLLKHLEAIFNGTEGIGFDAAPSRDGYRVFKVFSGSPADKAGIKKDDIITRINETNIWTVSDLRVLHVHFWGEPGHTIYLDVKDKFKHKEITLGYIPPQKKLLAFLFPDKNIEYDELPQEETSEK